jgi:hypothetical protein
VGDAFSNQLSRAFWLEKQPPAVDDGVSNGQSGTSVSLFEAKVDRSIADPPREDTDNQYLHSAMSMGSLLAGAASSVVSTSDKDWEDSEHPTLAAAVSLKRRIEKSRYLHCKTPLKFERAGSALNTDPKQ